MSSVWESVNCNLFLLSLGAGHIRLLRVSVWITSIGVSAGNNDVGAISRMYDTADLYPVEGGLPVLLVFFGLPPLESLL